MRFGDIIGNEEVKRALVRMADSGRIPHAMMFHENEGCGALPLAVAFLQYLNCRTREDGDSCGVCPVCNQISKMIYPDIHFVFPVAGEKVTSDSFLTEWRSLFVSNPYFMENELYEALGIEKKSSNISVAEAKNVLNALSLSSFSEGYRAVIIWLPEKMQAEASNRLLKIVEEPSEKTLFIFITHSPERVLKTIMSRCQLIRVMPASKEEIAAALPRWTGVDGEAAGYAAEFASGSLGAAIRSLAEKDSDVEMMDMFTSLMDGLLSRDFLAVLETAETLSSLDSREKQKAFCKFAGNCVRKIYMLRAGMDKIAGVRPDELQFYKDAAARCGEEFCHKAVAALSGACNMIIRNVNQKIVFTNLVDRLFVSVR
ncbi:MAG: ATP-binding protein [Candidatus Cryptobacteroides sp.]|nr:DNA polymerase III subunit delta [Bacteroidales bacterium]